MVQVRVGWILHLQCAEANVVEGFIINAEHGVGVLNELVNRECGIVRLNDSVGNLGGGNHGEGGHHPVRELLADLGEQQSTHTRASTTTQRVGELEALKAVRTFSLLADNIEDSIANFGTLGVVALGPVVAGSRLAADEVIGTEHVTNGARADGIECTRLQINQDGARNVAAIGGLIEVDADMLKFELLIGANVLSISVDGMLSGDVIPELGTNLVAALASLNAD